MYRIPLTPNGYPVSGASSGLVAANISKTYVDDFAIAANNGIFGAKNGMVFSFYIDPIKWKSSIVLSVSDYPIITGVTVVAVGRGLVDCNMLYAVSANPKANNQTQNARIVVVEL